MVRIVAISLAIAGLTLGVVTLGGCSTGRPSRSGGGRLQVVAAEDFWGSITARIAGDRAHVTSIITNPATDPHDYEPMPQDARDLASADYVVVNGIGYDSWAHKLLDADPNSDRVVLDVGKLIGLKAGDNPHQWYSPPVVDAFVERVAADLSRLDPAGADYYALQRDAYDSTGLAAYHAVIDEIRRDYAGTPIGGSESIVAPLVSALGLQIETPESFLDAVAEGNEPTARDTAIVDRQIADHAIAIFVYNRQNATPDVTRAVAAARAEGIPVATVTETMVPEGTTFAAWQVRVLRGIRDALARAA